MKIYKIAKNIKERMEEWYQERTKAHIDRVAKYCKKIAEFDDEFKDLLERSKIHDQSKYEEPEKSTYVYITWKYKCKDEGWDFADCNPPEDIEDKMADATMHHITNNKHHPEYHADKVAINKEDRDKPPSEMIDATKMPNIDVAEMCADWCAMSQEKGGNPQSWADKNVNVRWKFTDDQKGLIYRILDAVWEN